MHFRHLQTRLLAHIRTKVRNGEITERSLARLSGLSQPHIHNVLKGVRLLSVDVGDRILGCLRMDLENLLAAGEGGAVEHCMVPVLDGRIGPGHPYPHAISLEKYPFIATDLVGLISPVVARLAPDPGRASIFNSGGIVLVDRAEGPNLQLDEHGYFAMDLGGESAIGSVRRAGDGFYQWTHGGGVWRPFPPEDGPMGLIQGRVRLFAKRL